MTPLAHASAARGLNAVAQAEGTIAGSGAWPRAELALSSGERRYHFSETTSSERWRGGSRKAGRGHAASAAD
jgi:hypothetical protein